MNTLTIKLPADLDTELPASALSLAGDLVGCFSGSPGDLATNPKHMDDFGRTWPSSTFAADTAARPYR